MRHFSEYYLGFDDDSQHAPTWRENDDYDGDHLLPTPPPDAQEEADYRNSVQRDMLLDYLIHEDAPIIAVFAHIGAMLLDGIDTEAGKHFGQLAQEVYNLERMSIERKVGIK